MEITLYHSPGACSMAPYISLLDAGVEFNVETVSLRAEEHLSPEYTEVNPKQKVPFLLVDGRGLSENVAIHCWIASQFPEANLMPSDQWKYVKALSYMGWFGSAIHPHITRHFKTPRFCEFEEAHPDIKSKAKAMLFDQLKLVDQELAGRTWFFDHRTACDNYFFWVFDRALREGFDLDAFSNCKAHNNRMRELESVQKVIAHKIA